MSEQVIISAPAKWVKSSSVNINGTLYLTTERICFQQENKAPIVLDGAKVDWSNVDFLWEMALIFTRKASSKVGLTGPAITILDARNLPWTFILKDHKKWMALIEEAIVKSKL